MTKRILLFFLTLFFSCSFAFSQDYTITESEGKVGVKNDIGDWLINPVYEDIQKIEAEKPYYILFLKKGQNYIGNGKFDNSNIKGSNGGNTKSKFLVADRDFYVLSVQNYISLEIAAKNSPDRIPMIYLYHEKGVDMINVQKNAHVELGYSTHAEHILADFIHVYSGDKVGLYNMNKDIFVLEIFYDKIFLPYGTRHSSDPASKISFAKTQTYEYPEITNQVVVERKGKTGIFNLKTEEWTLDETPGTYVDVLDNDCSRVILANEDSQTLYVNGNRTIEVGEFKVNPMCLE